jgi:hypothetical protein
LGEAHSIILYYHIFVSPGVEVQLNARNDTNLFKEARDDAEKQICDKLKNKIDEFLELENYDWMLGEPQGHASSFITDLIAFLRTTFQSFTNLPVSVANAFQFGDKIENCTMYLLFSLRWPEKFVIQRASTSPSLSWTSW